MGLINISSLFICSHKNTSLLLSFTSEIRIQFIHCDQANVIRVINTSKFWCIYLFMSLSLCQLLVVITFIIMLKTLKAIFCKLLPNKLINSTTLMMDSQLKKSEQIIEVSMTDPILSLLFLTHDKAHEHQRQKF